MFSYSCLSEGGAESAPKSQRKDESGDADNKPGGAKVNFVVENGPNRSAIASAKTANISVENEREFVSTESKKLTFRPFSDNRMGFEIKRKTEKNPFAKGTISISTSSSDKAVFEEKLDLSQYM